MEPERGDRSIHVGAEDVYRGFRAVGAQPDDTLLYHGSLSSMGTVADGPATVVEGALAAVGPGGTVAMPTLWFHDADPVLSPAEFDVASSPSYIGTLSEAFRCDPRSVRSDHFSHSISAIGARAAELTTDHGAAGLHHTPWGPRAFADVSPWARLYEWNALYCFIGVTMRVCTMKHYVEARIVDECLQLAPVSERQRLREQLSVIGRPGIWPYFNSEELGEVLERQGVVKRSKIGSATLRAIRTQTLVDEAFTALRAMPETWFGASFLAWREECVGSQV